MHKMSESNILQFSLYRKFPFIINYLYLLQNMFNKFISMPYPVNSRIIDRLKLLPVGTQILFNKLFNKLFNNLKQIVDFKAILPFQQKKIEVPVCNRSLLSKDESYRCYDCSLCEGTLICNKCFNIQKHKGHRYVQVKEEGMCDCGHEDILLKTAFCSNHIDKNNQCKILPAQSFKFDLMMRELFIWSFKLLLIGAQLSSISLCQALIEYLLELTQNSMHYLTLTSTLFLQNKSNIIVTLFKIIQTNNNSNYIYSFIKLILRSCILPEFKTKCMIIYIQSYKSSNYFQNSKLTNLFSQLFSNSDQVYETMTKNRQAFLPPNPNGNLKVYLSHLFYISKLRKDAVLSFFRPIVEVNFIDCPLMTNIQSNCEVNNRPIIQVFTEYTNQQFGYYKLLIKIISVMDKQGLKYMAKHYYHMVKKYPCKKNIIILVPQRIFILIIYKYFQFNLQLFSIQELAAVLEVTEGELLYALRLMGRQFLMCLGEYAMNLVRTTYFDNYLSIYVEQKCQIIVVDYLAIRMLAVGLKDLDSFNNFQSIVINVYERQLTEIIQNCELNNLDYQINKQIEQFYSQFYKKWNNLIMILQEVAFSPRTELMCKIYLDNWEQVQKQAELTLCSIINTVGDITATDFELFMAYFIDSQGEKQWMNNFIFFNKQKKKFQLKTQHKQKIMMKMFTSLLKTNLSVFVTKQYPQIQKMLSQSQAQLQLSIVPSNLMYQLVNKQLTTIFDLTELYSILIKDSIFLAKYLRSFYQQEIIQFLLLKLIEDQIKLKLDQSFQNDQPQFNQAQLLKELQEIQSSLKSNVKIDNKNDQKRKQMLKDKKMRIMKDKKMLQNRSIFIDNQQQIKQINPNHEVCLICKGSQNQQQMCYYAKIKQSDLLYKLMQNTELKNNIFSSCFHTVHYSCYFTTTNNNNHCILCQKMCNILLPLENGNGAIRQKCSINIQNVIGVTNMNTSTQKNINIFYEGILFLLYMFYLNNNKQATFDKLHIKICRTILPLIQLSYLSMDNQSRETQRNNILAHFKFLKQINKEFVVYVKLVIQQLVDHFDHIQNRKIDLLRLMEGQTVLQTKISEIQLVSTQLNIGYILFGVRFSQEEQIQNIKVQYPIITFLQTLQFYQPPSSLNELLILRDDYFYKCQKKQLSHHKCICLVCKHISCYQCNHTADHGKTHLNQCLFFNVSTGGFYYYSQKMQISIRSFYVSETGVIWKPEQQMHQFTFDRELYKKMLTALKNGTAFYFLIRNFQGLTNQNIRDII